MKELLAIMVSDLHLQHRPPLARAEEPDWYEAMARPLREIRELCAQNPSAKVIYAGDIFDRWNPPPQVINFAIKELPPGYAVPGQHDLPCHAYDQRHRSAYGTLVAAKVIRDLPPAERVRCGGGLNLVGFPWGFDLEERPPQVVGLTVAVCHRFIWRKGATYPGAPEAGHVRSLQRKLQGFDVGLFGDNHKPFDVPARDRLPAIHNNGGMMIRKADEAEHRPSCGLLYVGDGPEACRIERHYFDTSEDLLTVYRPTEEAPDALDLEAFTATLESFGAEDGCFDFGASVRNYIREQQPLEPVKKAILEALDGSE